MRLLAELKAGGGIQAPGWNRACFALTRRVKQRQRV